MEWKEFFIDFLDKTIWPVVIVFLILSFKKQLTVLLGKVGRFKYKDFEIDFHKLENELSKLKKQSSTPFQQKATESIIFNSEEFDLHQQQALSSLEKTPATSILLSWSYLEASIDKAISRINKNNEKVAEQSTIDKIMVLKEMKEITQQQANVLLEMLSLRNQIINRISDCLLIKNEEAYKFVESAFNLSKTISLLIGYERTGTKKLGKWVELPEGFKSSGMAALSGHSKIKRYHTKESSYNIDVGPVENDGQRDIYTITITKKSSSGGDSILDFLAFEINKYVDKEILNKDVIEFVSYDDKNRIFTIDLGKSIFKYKLISGK